MSRNGHFFRTRVRERPCAGLDRRAARGQDFARTGALVVAIDAPWSRRKELPDFTQKYHEAADEPKDVRWYDSEDFAPAESGVGCRALARGEGLHQDR